MEPSKDTATQRLLTFRVDQQLYALPAGQVAEVIRVPTLARIPQGPIALLGLANLRGAVLPMASLRLLLNKPIGNGTIDERAIVLDVGAPIALVVDAVETLEIVDANQVETHSKEVHAEGVEKLVGAFANKVNKEVAKVLDIKKMLEMAFSQRMRVQRQTRINNSASISAVVDDSSNSEVIVSFDVAGQEFALPLEAVQEIMATPTSITSVPRAESVVLGVISVRDSLLPLLSLRALLGFAPSKAMDEREKVIVMKVAGTQIGLVADRARAIVVANNDHIDALPPILAVRTGGESRIRSIYRAEAGRLISILSPEQLFREDVMQKLVASQRAADSKNANVQMDKHEELIFLVFKLGNEEFGLPIDTVVEVAQVPQQITRVPKTPKFLEGLVNLRGDVLPVVDQRRRFEMPKLENLDGRKLVVVKTDRYRAGLIVDSVSDVLRTSSDKIEPPPDLTDATSRLVRGVINLDIAKRMVLVLDPTEVLTRAEQSVLDKFEADQKANA